MTGSAGEHARHDRQLEILFVEENEMLTSAATPDVGTTCSTKVQMIIGRGVCHKNYAIAGAAVIVVNLVGSKFLRVSFQHPEMGAAVGPPVQARMPLVGSRHVSSSSALSSELLPAPRIAASHALGRRAGG